MGEFKGKGVERLLEEADAGYKNVRDTIKQKKQKLETDKVKVKEQKESNQAQIKELERVSKTIPKESKAEQKRNQSERNTLDRKNKALEKSISDAETEIKSLEDNITKIQNDYKVKIEKGLEYQEAKAMMDAYNKLKKEYSEKIANENDTAKKEKLETDLKSITEYSDLQISSAYNRLKAEKNKGENSYSVDDVKMEAARRNRVDELYEHAIELENHLNRDAIASGQEIYKFCDKLVEGYEKTFFNMVEARFKAKGKAFDFNKTEGKEIVEVMKDFGHERIVKELFGVEKISELSPMQIKTYGLLTQKALLGNLAPNGRSTKFAAEGNAVTQTQLLFIDVLMSNRTGSLGMGGGKTEAYAIADGMFMLKHGFKGQVAERLVSAKAEVENTINRTGDFMDAFFGIESINAVQLYEKQGAYKGEALVETINALRQKGKNVEFVIDIGTDGQICNELKKNKAFKVLRERVRLTADEVDVLLAKENSFIQANQIDATLGIKQRAVDILEVYEMGVAEGIQKHSYDMELSNYNDIARYIYDKLTKDVKFKSHFEGRTKGEIQHEISSSIRARAEIGSGQVTAGNKTNAVSGIEKGVMDGDSMNGVTTQIYQKFIEKTGQTKFDRALFEQKVSLIEKFKATVSRTSVESATQEILINEPGYKLSRCGGSGTLAGAQTIARALHSSVVTITEGTFSKYKSQVKATRMKDGNLYVLEEIYNKKTGKVEGHEWVEQFEAIAQFVERAQGRTWRREAYEKKDGKLQLKRDKSGKFELEGGSLILLEHAKIGKAVEATVFRMLKSVKGRGGVIKAIEKLAKMEKGKNTGRHSAIESAKDLSAEFVDVVFENNRKANGKYRSLQELLTPDINGKSILEYKEGKIQTTGPQPREVSVSLADVLGSEIIIRDILKTKSNITFQKHNELIKKLQTIKIFDNYSNPELVTKTAEATSKQGLAVFGTDILGRGMDFKSKIALRKENAEVTPSGELRQQNGRAERGTEIQGLRQTTVDMGKLGRNLEQSRKIKTEQIKQIKDGIDNIEKDPYTSREVKAADKRLLEREKKTLENSIEDIKKYEEFLTNYDKLSNESVKSAEKFKEFTEFIAENPRQLNEIVQENAAFISTKGKHRASMYHITETVTSTILKRPLELLSLQAAALGAGKDQEIIDLMINEMREGRGKEAKIFEDINKYTKPEDAFYDAVNNQIKLAAKVYKHLRGDAGYVFLLDMAKAASPSVARNAWKFKGAVKNRQIRRKLDQYIADLRDAKTHLKQTIKGRNWEAAIRDPYLGEKGYTYAELNAQAGKANVFKDVVQTSLSVAKDLIPTTKRSGIDVSSAKKVKIIGTVVSGRKRGIVASLDGKAKAANEIAYSVKDSRRVDAKKIPVLDIKMPFTGQRSDVVWLTTEQMKTVQASPYYYNLMLKSVNKHDRRIIISDEVGSEDFEILHTKRDKRGVVTVDNMDRGVFQSVYGYDSFPKLIVPEVAAKPSAEAVSQLPVPSAPPEVEPSATEEPSAPPATEEPSAPPAPEVEPLAPVLAEEAPPAYSVLPDLKLPAKVNGVLADYKKPEIEGGLGDNWQESVGVASKYLKDQKLGDSINFASYEQKTPNLPAEKKYKVVLVSNLDGPFGEGHYGVRIVNEENKVVAEGKIVSGSKVQFNKTEAKEFELQQDAGEMSSLVLDNVNDANFGEFVGAVNAGSFVHDGSNSNFLTGLMAAYSYQVNSTLAPKPPEAPPAYSDAAGVVSPQPVEAQPVAAQQTQTLPSAPPLEPKTIVTAAKEEDIAGAIETWDGKEDLVVELDKETAKKLDEKKKDELRKKIQSKQLDHNKNITIVVKKEVEHWDLVKTKEQAVDVILTTDKDVQDAVVKKSKAQRELFKRKPWNILGARKNTNMFRSLLRKNEYNLTDQDDYRKYIGLKKDVDQAIAKANESGDIEKMKEAKKNDVSSMIQAMMSQKEGKEIEDSDEDLIGKFGTDKQKELVEKKKDLEEQLIKWLPTVVVNILEDNIDSNQTIALKFNQGHEEIRKAVNKGIKKFKDKQVGIEGIGPNIVLMDPDGKNQIDNYSAKNFYTSRNDDIAVELGETIILDEGFQQKPFGQMTRKEKITKLYQEFKAVADPTKSIVIDLENLSGRETIAEVMNYVSYLITNAADIEVDKVVFKKKGRYFAASDPQLQKKLESWYEVQKQARGESSESVAFLSRLRKPLLDYKLHAKVEKQLTAKLGSLKRDVSKAGVLFGSEEVFGDVMVTALPAPESEFEPLKEKIKDGDKEVEVLKITESGEHKKVVIEALDKEIKTLNENKGVFADMLRTAEKVRFKRRESLEIVLPMITPANEASVKSLRGTIVGLMKEVTEKEDASGNRIPTAQIDLKFANGVLIDTTDDSKKTNLLVNRRKDIGLTVDSEVVTIPQAVTNAERLKGFMKNILTKGVIPSDQKVFLKLQKGVELKDEVRYELTQLLQNEYAEEVYVIDAEGRVVFDSAKLTRVEPITIVSANANRRKVNSLRMSEALKTSLKSIDNIDTDSILEIPIGFPAAQFIKYFNETDELKNKNIELVQKVGKKDISIWKSKDDFITKKLYNRLMDLGALRYDLEDEAALTSLKTETDIADGLAVVNKYQMIFKASFDMTTKQKKDYITTINQHVKNGVLGHCILLDNNNRIIAVTEGSSIEGFVAQVEDGTLVTKELAQLKKPGVKPKQIDRVEKLAKRYNTSVCYRLSKPSKKIEAKQVKFNDVSKPSEITLANIKVLPSQAFGVRLGAGIIPNSEIHVTHDTVDTFVKLNLENGITAALAVQVAGATFAMPGLAGAPAPLQMVVLDSRLHEAAKESEGVITDVVRDAALALGGAAAQVVQGQFLLDLVNQESEDAFISNIRNLSVAA
ncbi:hypothetical protein ACFL4A_03960 [bacterium]